MFLQYAARLPRGRPAGREGFLLHRALARKLPRFCPTGAGYCSGAVSLGALSLGALPVAVPCGSSPVQCPRAINQGPVPRGQCHGHFFIKNLFLHPKIFSFPKIFSVEKNFPIQKS